MIKKTVSNYKSASIRIARASTSDCIKRLEVSFARIHDTGHLTDSELGRLDRKIVGRMIEMENTND